MTQSIYPITRIVVVFLPLVYFLTLYLFEQIAPYKKTQKALMGTLILCSLWSFLFQMYLYFYSQNLIFWSDFFPLTTAQSVFHHSLLKIASALKHSEQLLTFLLLFSPLILICALGVSIFNVQKKLREKILARGILVLALLYATITVFNVYNHDKNTTLWLASNCYKRQGIATKSETFAYDEIKDIVENSKIYYRSTQYNDYVLRLDEWMNQYRKRVRGDIFIDPSNYTKEIVSAHKESFWIDSERSWHDFLIETEAHSFCRRF